MVGAMKGLMKGQVAKLTDKDIEEIAEAPRKEVVSQWTTTSLVVVQHLLKL